MGVTRPKITLADFRNIKVAVPILTEQEETVNIFSRQRRLIETELTRLKKLEKQKFGLMHDLLTSKVKVTSNCPIADEVNA